MGKINTSDIKNGLNIILDGNIYTVIEFLHVKPGKGGAFVRTKVKGVSNNKTLDRTFKTGETLESVRVERHPYQFLYSDGEFMHFMHGETFEQIMISVDKVEAAEFLKESGEVVIVINADVEEILYAEVPNHVELKVVQTDPGLRGDTAQGGTKPATLESGAVINVPLFINEGDVLRVDTRERSYIERVKN